jgi:carbamoyltransferase
MDYRKDFCPELDDAFLSWQDRIDLCASGQKLFEDLILCEAERIRRTYGALPLYYAGGCALSVKANSKLKQLFPALVIPPNCGDDGIALGAVAAHAFLSHQKRLSPLNLEDGLSSPSMSCWNIEGKLSREDVERVARWLSAGEVVAFAQGAPEAGPRALCKRSILASPASAGMKEIINHIKEREYYRPVAPIVLDSFGGELVENYFYSPFMLYSFIVKDQWRPRIPAALHVDGSARLQSIPDDNTDIAKLLRTYAKMSDSPPVLLNTSLNSRGKPIASLRKQIETEIKKLKIKYLVLGGEAIELS